MPTATRKPALREYGAVPMASGLHSASLSLVLAFVLGFVALAVQFFPLPWSRLSRFFGVLLWIAAGELLFAYFAPLFWFYIVGPAIGGCLVLAYLLRLRRESEARDEERAAAEVSAEWRQRQRACVDHFLYDAGARADEFEMFYANEALPSDERQPSSLSGSALDQAAARWRMVVSSFLALAFSSGEKRLFQAVGARGADGQLLPPDQFMALQKNRLDDLIRRSSSLPIRADFNPEPWESAGSLDGPAFLREPWKQP
jgi:hypothetical protein